MLAFFKKKESTSQEGLSLHERSRQLVSIDTSFDVNLTIALKKEHQDIIRFLQKIERNALGKPYKTKELIREFITMFVSHVTKEQYRVYSHLEREMKRNIAFINRMKKYRKDLNTVNSEIRQLKNAANGLGLKPNASVEFQTSLTRFKTVLIKRIETEENELFYYYDNIQDLKQNPHKYIPTLGVKEPPSFDISELTIESQDSISNNADVENTISI